MSKYFDMLAYLMGKQAGGGGGDITVVSKSISANGTHTAPAGKAYSPVIVDVPNSYAAGDEGKVVSNGELVAQGSDTATQNGPVDTTLISSLTVNVSGGGADDPIPAPLKDVVFVDYDGEIVEQYTADEFLALSALPANPSHTGLTAQGWNWTLADAKTYVQSHGCLCIGQNYTTSDGKTRIYLDFTSQNTIGRPFYISLQTTVKGGVTIDWGDGTSMVTTANANASGIYHHTYAAGKYTLTLECTSGTYYLGFNGSNKGIFYDNSDPASIATATAVTAIEVGNGVTELQRQGFSKVRNLRTISIPTTLTLFGGTTGNVFQEAVSLKCLVFPSGTTAINGSISSVTFLSAPKSLSGLGGVGGTNLRMLTLTEAGWGTGKNWTFPIAERIVIPGTYTQLGTGSTGKCITGTCYCRKFVVPASVTLIKDYALIENPGLTELHLLPTTVPTLENSRALTSGPSNRVIYVPYSEDHSILAAYQAASNWSTYASSMQEEPQ